MQEGNKNRSNSVITRIGMELKEAQAVLVHEIDETVVWAWLSKDGELYFEGMATADIIKKMKDELRDKGYKVV